MGTYMLLNQSETRAHGTSGRSGIGDDPKQLLEAGLHANQTTLISSNHRDSGSLQSSENQRNDLREKLRPYGNSALAECGV
jgi:hypothetical protein